MAAITIIPSELLKQNVVLMLVFPTLHRLHTWNFLSANSKHLVIFIFVSLHYGYKKHKTPNIFDFMFQLNASFVYYIFFYIPLHVSSNIVLIIRSNYCIHTAPGSL